ncbi:MAG: hypothetical protein JJ916_06910 [Phycisphaerales bacterium]|nr:hypothetical protein [Phycisphaerales bacterium]
MVETILQNITDDRGMFTIFIIFGMGGLIAIIGIVFGSIKSTAETKEREKSRREIAAYIAEGSMSAEDGERLLRAGNPKTASELALEQQARHA